MFGDKVDNLERRFGISLTLELNLVYINIDLRKSQRLDRSTPVINVATLWAHLLFGEIFSYSMLNSLTFFGF